jgi:Cu(I)/Ag(I) efflux system membrane fusion protein
VVTKKELTPGSRLEAGAMAYELVDLSTVWVTAQVPEAQLRFVTAGVEGTLALTAFPGRTWSGQVRFIDPQLDPATRTVRVRLAFDNPKGELRPELFGELRLARPSRQVLQVPTDAIVPGPKPLVFVARGGGRFEPRVVTLGEATGERTEVKGGLGEGDEVVTGGLFLLDSEASLRASLRRAEAAP